MHALRARGVQVVVTSSATASSDSSDAKAWRMLRARALAERGDVCSRYLVNHVGTARRNLDSLRSR
jgi:hypothetical protein